jgi:ribosomal protein S18 acetylase RimI-like enzyme
LIPRDGKNGTPLGKATVHIEWFTDSRSEIRWLFEQADDSESEIDAYIEAGEVLVARCSGRVAGHLQIIRSGLTWEMKSIAVDQYNRRRGIGTALVQAVIQKAVSEGCGQLMVATATADIGNIRFYEKMGFRIDNIERDVFTAARGYADAELNGVPRLDRVWLKMDIHHALGQQPH